MSQGVSIEVRGVTKRFGRAAVLDDVSFSIEAGSFTTLLGPSGCGKTTILRALAGLTSIDRGTILMAGADVTRLPTQARNAILVFQDYALFPHMTVSQNVAYGLKLRKESREMIGAKLERTMNYLGIQPLGDRKVAQLSGGQQQRVALARALVMEPHILLLDEPMSNLDAQLRLGIRSELRRIGRDLGITTVYVTHDQAEALALSDRIVVMNQGRIVQIGTPRDVYLRPADDFVARFVGSANLLTAAVVSATEGKIQLCADNLTLVVPGGGSATVGEVWKFCLRPESLSLTDVANVATVGTIDQAMFEGSHTRYEVCVGKTRLIVDDFGRNDRPIGTTVGVRIDPDKIHRLPHEERV